MSHNLKNISKYTANSFNKRDAWDVFIIACGIFWAYHVGTTYHGASFWMNLFNGVVLGMYVHQIYLSVKRMYEKFKNKNADKNNEPACVAALEHVDALIGDLKKKDVSVDTQLKKINDGYAGRWRSPLTNKVGYQIGSKIDPENFTIEQYACMLHETGHVMKGHTLRKPKNHNFVLDMAHRFRMEREANEWVKQNVKYHKEEVFGFLATALESYIARGECIVELCEMIDNEDDQLFYDYIKEDLMFMKKEMNKVKRMAWKMSRKEG